MTCSGTLILLRHGRTAWNASGRFQGQADPPLDGTGLAQATRAATQLRTLEPDAVVSSDLQRATQTAELVGASCALAVTVDSRLREVALGRWEGLSPSDAAAAFPEEYAAWAAGRDVRRGGGETEQEAGRRALASLAPLLERCRAGQTAVVVSHGLVLRSVLRGLADRADLKGPVPVRHLTNGQWTSIHVELSR